MPSQSENAYWAKEGAPAPCTTQLEKKLFKVGQVLETMRNLIVEIQIFKADNEKLTRDKEKNEDIN